MNTHSKKNLFDELAEKVAEIKLSNKGRHTLDEMSLLNNFHRLQIVAPPKLAPTNLMNQIIYARLIVKVTLM